jgi:hypothetical protein
MTVMEAHNLAGTSLDQREILSVITRGLLTVTMMLRLAPAVCNAVRRQEHSSAFLPTTVTMLHTTFLGLLNSISS